ncbi:MAG: hypothetical protein JXR25_11075 [Pontiellaceae bacterium]|nr:hypothetical protein [Pontiellaceae bacterium]
MYRDKDGKELYKVKRVDYADGRKDCFQEYMGRPTLPAEVRTLYNLDRIHGNTGDYIVLAEGEKTADALIECGYIGTTNPLGSGNWVSRYAGLLRGQKVIVMPDADQGGEKWRKAVLDSLRGVAAQVQIVNMPDDFINAHPEFKGHDFADYLQVHGKDAATLFMTDAITATPILPNGVEPELLGRPGDIWDGIVARANAGISTVACNLGEWLPSLPIQIRQGDLLTLMANTGIGKTRLLHNLPYHIRRLNYAIFDLELSRETLAIRYAAMENRCSVDSVEKALEQRKRLRPPGIENVFIQKESSLTVEKIAERVELLERVTSRTIHVVAVDYIGLMTGQGSSYESTTTNVEAFKAYVSATGKVGILTTQVSRPENKERGLFECPSPFSAKNSGSIENSSQILLGFWRDQNCRRTLWARCLKYTHGQCPDGSILLSANDLLIEEAR